MILRTRLTFVIYALTVDTPAARRVFPGFPIVPGLDLPDAKQVPEPGGNAVQGKNDEQVRGGIQPLVEEVADGNPDGDGSGKHNPHGGIIREFSFFFRLFIVHHSPFAVTRGSAPPRFKNRHPRRLP